MTVENATYIPQLNPNNPAGTDYVEEGDDHITLIKQVLQNQFPLLGNNVVSPAAAELNNVVGSTSNIQAQLDQTKAPAYGVMLSSESGDQVSLNNSFTKFTQAGAASFSDAGVSVSPSLGTISVLRTNPVFVRLTLVLELKRITSSTTSEGHVVRGVMVRESNNAQLPGSLTLTKLPRYSDNPAFVVIKAIDPSPAAASENYHFELNQSHTAALSFRIQSLSFGLEVVGGV